MKKLKEETKRNKNLNAPGMIHQYSDQPSSLPQSLRRHLGQFWNGEVIQLYAFVDLDASLRLSQQWLVLGEKSLAVAKFAGGDKWLVNSVAREDIRSVKEVPGLSCSRLVISGKDDFPLFVLRYSHRQRRALSHLQFVLEQQVKNEGGVEVKPESSDEIYQEAILDPIRGAQDSVAVNKFAVVWRLLSYLKPYWKQVAFGMLGAFAMTGVSLLPPFVTGYLIDSVVKPFQNGSLSQPQALNMAWMTIAGLVLVYVLRELFAWIRLKTMTVIGEFVAKDLRDHVYSHLHKLSLSYFSSKQTGSLISRVGSDTDRIWDFIAFGVVEVSTSLIMLLGLGLVLVSLDPTMGLMVVAPLPVLLWMILRHGQQMQSLFLRAWRKWSALTDVLSDTIPGIRVVKAFDQGKYETQRFENRNDEVLGEFNRIHRAWTGFWPLLMLSIQTLVVMVWVIGVPRVLGANELLGPLTAGTFVAFVMYMGMFVQPIEVIGQMARMVNRATSSAHRVFEVLDTEPKVEVENKRVRLTPVHGHVEFEKVCFSYDGVRQILKNVNFTVEPGEMIGLVGPSGSGKTTIINLIARFYDPSSGSICIDGVNIKDLDVGAYRRQTGMVLQDPYLFHGSILSNIRYANPQAGLAEAIEAAKAANAHEFICRLPHAYDTVVGERGHTLSGGERQRISIARAILGNPRVLIMDEATSSVDTETERKIQEALDRLVKGRTVFAIAHRLSTLTKATRLLVVKEGRIVETGSHSELLVKPDGVYSKLYKMQQDLNEVIGV